MLTDFESTFFVVSLPREPMAFSYVKYYIIPYCAIKEITEGKSHIKVKLKDNYNETVNLDKNIFIIKEGINLKCHFLTQGKGRYLLKTINAINLTTSDT